MNKNRRENLNFRSDLRKRVDYFCI